MRLQFKVGGLEIHVNGVRGISTLVGVGLLSAAVLQELRRPPEDRNWHGRVLGFVPYDFRAPTIDRVREEFWNTKNPKILTPHAFGVGWGINFGALAKKLALVA